MKITNKLKNNNKGFGHIEMLLVIVAVVIIGAVGFFVYQNHNKKTATKSTAHAGGWTPITKGQLCTNDICTTSIGYEAFACYTNAGAFGSYVKAAIILAQPTPWPNSTTTTIYDYSQANYNAKLNWQKIETGNWLYGAFHTTAPYLINTSVGNFIEAYPEGPNYGGSLKGVGRGVTNTWVHATGLASC
jgi:hypothetical protein